MDRRRLAALIGIRPFREQRLDQIERIASLVVQERVLVVVEVAQLDCREQGSTLVVVGEVRVGASLEQLCRQRDLAIQQRDEQRRGVVPARLIDIGAELEQQPRHRHVAVANREEQRRHTAVFRRQRALPDDAVARRAASPRRNVLALRRRDRGLRLDVRAACHQQFDDVRVVLGDGPHQRRLRAHGVLRVGVGAAIEEQCHGVGLAGARRSYQRRLATRRRGVHIGTSVEQPAEDRSIAVERGEMHWRDTVPRRRFHVCATFDQGVDTLEVIGAHRLMQRRRSVRDGCAAGGVRKDTSDLGVHRSPQRE